MHSGAREDISGVGATVEMPERERQDRIGKIQMMEITGLAGRITPVRNSDRSAASAGILGPASPMDIRRMVDPERQILDREER